MALPPRWTYSALEQFETCPRQFHALRVTRSVVEPPSEHSIWGERVHTAFEYRIKNDDPLPEGMQQWEVIARKIEAMPGNKITECRVAVDGAFKATPWKDRWVGGVIDLMVLHKTKAGLLDYKTGKRKPSEQLRLYAALAFESVPGLETIQTSYIWLKEKKTDVETITIDETPKIWQEFLPRVERLGNAYEKNAWPAKPSGLCKAYCPVLDCEHNGRKT